MPTSGPRTGLSKALRSASLLTHASLAVLTGLVTLAQAQKFAEVEVKPVAAAVAAPSESAAPATTPATTPVATPEPAAPVATPPAPPAVPMTLAEKLAPDVRRAIDALPKTNPANGLSAAQARKIRDAVSSFYAARKDAPLWLDAEGHWTLAAKGALTRLEHADEDALDIKRASLPVLNETEGTERTNTDVALSVAVMTYGRQASDGRVDARSVTSGIDDKKDPANLADILTKVAASSDGDAALRSFNPPQAGYAALRTKLAEVRRESPKTVAKIPGGPVLKVGMEDARVPLIRARFGLDGQTPAEASKTLVYDTRVAEAVAGFQREKGIPATGNLTTRTILALSGGDAPKLENEIIANMERWRWLPREMGKNRVEVNIPDYALKVIKDGAVVHRAKVIVGKATTPTPVFSNAMQFIIVNPSWYVPQSIIKKEMLPRLASDPGYLSRQGYSVTYSHGRMSVRQPPGERNALGHIKFLFPNDHSVYLHDTPTRALFGQNTRAFSHGCVRVDQPLALAEVVLGRENGWSQEKFKSLIGKSERTLKLPDVLPIHIEYFTAYVDEDGKLQLRDDIYGYSRKTQLALGLN